jgi:hypothetical protein
MGMMMTMMDATNALKATGLGPHARIQSVAVIEVEALTPAAQSEVYATAAQAGDADLLALHEAIETSPMGVMALAQSAAGASEIIAASVDGSGTLILIANRGF